MEILEKQNWQITNCHPLEFVDKKLTLYVHNNLGDRCVMSSIVKPTVIIYGVILLLGILGNICTCWVIIKNKCMQNPTNYYLFSLAISDLLMLVLGLPMELYGVFDVLYPYRFGEFVCKSRAFLIEFTSYASILTITCFSVERWLAICFPLRVKIFSTFDRAVKMIITVWICAFIAAIPVVFIVVLNKLPIPDYVYKEKWLSKITVDNRTIIGTDYCAMDFQRPEAQKVFIYSAFLLFFLLPALLITIVYCHIVLKLTKSTKNIMGESAKQKVRTRKGLLKILVSVVVMFFLCWLPHHIQRLLTIYLNESQESEHYSNSTSTTIHSIFNVVFYISGYCYYSNSACNPILYNILSAKYRLAFCKTILGERLTEKLWNNDKNTTFIKSSFRYNNYSPQQFVSTFSKNSKRRTLKLSPVENTMPTINRRNFSLRQTNRDIFYREDLLKLSKTPPLSSSASLNSPLISRPLRLGTIVRVKLRGNSKERSNQYSQRCSINSLHKEHKLLNQKNNNNCLLVNHESFRKYPKNLLINSIEHL